MDSGELVNALRLTIAFVVLIYCSVLDWRTRKVGNTYWVALSLVGIALLLAQPFVDEAGLESFLVIMPIAAILADVYLGQHGSPQLQNIAPYIEYSVAIASVILLALAWGGDTYFQHFLAVPVMMLFVVALYITDIIKGGADAKALIALAILFPFYPRASEFPLLDFELADTEIFFPFALTVLVNAAILVALMPVFFLARNLAAKEFESPQGFLGYKTDVREIAGKHVWLMERVENGRPMRYTRPRSDEDLGKEVELLAEAGRSRVWVTPKIPFIVPMTVSLVLSALVGNLLLLLFPI